MPKRIVVIGGGVSGLATAWNLKQALAPSDAQITLLEKDSRPGGTAWTERIDGYSLETGPNGFLDNKPSMVDLCKSVGLTDQLIRANASAEHRYVFLGDRLRKLPSSPGQFLRSDLLSWRGKLRVLAERLIKQKRQSSDETIYDFGCRRIGREATEVLLDAFVTGILAGDPKLLSLPACFPRMAQLEREFGSLIRAQGQLAKQRRAERIAQGLPAKRPASTGGPGGALTAPRGGMRAVIEAIRDRLGPDAHLGIAAQSLQRQPDSQWLIRTEGAEQWQADAVVLACPAPQQARILEHVAPELASEIAAIPYTAVAVVAVGFHRRDVPAERVNGFGYLAPQRLGRPVLGALWSSSIFPEQAPPDQFQFRILLGGWTRRDVLTWDDDAIIRAALDDLRATLGLTAPPCFTWIRRWEQAIPQYHLGHLDRLQRIDTLLAHRPGLFLTGNAYRGVSLNDCAADAALTSAKVVSYLNRT